MRFCAVICVLLLFVSCGEKEQAQPVVNEPADLIAEEKMILVLADVHILEAALQQRSPQLPGRNPNVMIPVPSGGPQNQNTPQTPFPAALPPDQKTLPYYDIFAKHAVTRDQYERSLQWYMLDPELFGEMYDEVINELVRRQAKEQGVVQPPAGDSVKK